MRLNGRCARTLSQLVHTCLTDKALYNLLLILRSQLIVRTSVSEELLDELIFYIMFEFTECRVAIVVPSRFSLRGSAQASLLLKALAELPILGLPAHYRTAIAVALVGSEVSFSETFPKTSTLLLTS